MALKTAPTTFTIPQTTNYLTFPSINDIKDQNKCFVHFPNNPYLKGALTANPTLYIEAFEEFWRTIMCTEIGMENGSTMIKISCVIKGIVIIFIEHDVNKALDLSTEDFVVEATNDIWWSFWSSLDTIVD